MATTITNPFDFYQFCEYWGTYPGVKDGVAFRFHFPNGYGASVVRAKGTYGANKGLYELAVLKYDKDGSFDICYDTEIAKDVIGGLNVKEVNNLLSKISIIEFN